MFKETHVINADVLVVGGGAAAARAALESAKLGAQTVLVTKGKFGLSGTSSYRVAEAAGFSASGIAHPEDNPDIHYNDILNAGLGPVRKSLARIVAEGAPSQVPVLEKLGVDFQRYEGNYLATKGCFASEFRSLKIYGHGEAIVRALKNELLKQECIRIFEHSMVTQLLVDSGVCKGAVALDSSGNILEIHAKCTILGAGGAGQLFEKSLNPPDVTGDGYALAYLAGAQMVNMEFMQAGFGIVDPALALFNSWFWLVDPQLKDENGNSFIENYLPENLTVEQCIEKKGTHYPYSTRDCSMFLEVACVKKCNEGGKVYVDLRDVDKREHKENKNLSQMWTLTKNWMKAEKGIDLDRDVLQLCCMAHAFNGGALVNDNMQTSVDRLYAVGENCGGAHGADRLGGNMFASGQVFGEIAGKHAANTAMNSDTDTYSATITMRANGECRDCSVDSLFKELQQLASRTLLIVRTEDGLTRFKKEAERIRACLDKCFCADIHQYRRREELYNLIETGSMVAEAALMRTESRGSHYREDFPAPGGDNWTKAIVIEHRDGKSALSLREI